MDQSTCRCCSDLEIVVCFHSLFSGASDAPSLKKAVFCFYVGSINFLLLNIKIRVRPKLICNVNQSTLINILNEIEIL